MTRWIHEKIVSFPPCLFSVPRRDRAPSKDLFLALMGRQNSERIWEYMYLIVSFSFFSDSSSTSWWARKKMKTLKWMKSTKRWSKSSGTDFAVISNTHCVVLSNVHFEKETASTTRVWLAIPSESLKAVWYYIGLATLATFICLAFSPALSHEHLRYLDLAFRLQSDTLLKNRKALAVQMCHECRHPT